MQKILIEKQIELRKKKLVEAKSNLRKFIGKRMFSELASDSSDEEEQFRRLRYQAYKKYIQSGGTNMLNCLGLGFDDPALQKIKE